MRKPKIGFQGELGAFSQEAARQFLGEAVSVVPYQRFEDVFKSLDAGDTDASVIPIENTDRKSVV